MGRTAEEKLKKVLKHDVKFIGLTACIAQDRNLWRFRKKVADHRLHISSNSFGFHSSRDCVLVISLHCI